MEIDLLRDGLPAFDATHEVYYDKSDLPCTGGDGLVVRTVADGDDLLPCTRVRAVQFVVTDTPQVSPLSGKTSKPKLPEKTRKTDSVRSMNTQAVKAIMEAFGYTGRITPHMRRTCLELIALERATQAGL